ncbi:MAG: argininosuccinate lyase [Spirochaetes bacterium]|nr:argininosuccinate lyase [Spirochaetota bacterium]
MKGKKLWGGRFEQETATITEKISASVDFDKRLYRQDIHGSIVHAEMLRNIGVLNDEECRKIVNGLQEILKEIEENKFEFFHSLEDVHMNIEYALTQKIGEVGKKLHTARSRNDQVALDMRLYLREECALIRRLIAHVVHELVTKAETHLEIIMPAYTHLQVAQPVRFSHYLLAHAWALVRDIGRLEAAERASMVLPLGVGACAGVNYRNDREFLRKKLGFASISQNSMDTVSDRDYILDFLYFAAVLGMHLSRMAEELVLWSTSEFGFIRLSDSVTTGSSIMPQKRNPDVAELIRGKSGRLYGNLMSLLVTMKGLPLTYNRDMQEDKEPLFDSIDTVKMCLEGMKEMIATMEVNGGVMRNAVYSNYSTATDLADYLVKKGVPFREAHEIVGAIVKHCEREKKDFFSLTHSDLQMFSNAFDSDAVNLLDPMRSTENKVSAGGTALVEVEKQIRELKHILKSLGEVR